MILECLTRTQLFYFWLLPYPCSHFIHSNKLISLHIRVSMLRQITIIDITQSGRYTAVKHCRTKAFVFAAL